MRIDEGKDRLVGIWRESESQCSVGIGIHGAVVELSLPPPSLVHIRWDPKFRQQCAVMGNFNWCIAAKSLYYNLVRKSTHNVSGTEARSYS